MHMGRVRGELAGFSQRMDGDDFPALVEHAEQPGFPARPDLPADILRGHRIVDLFFAKIALLLQAATLPSRFSHAGAKGSLPIYFNPDWSSHWRQGAAEKLGASRRAID